MHCSQQVPGRNSVGSRRDDPLEEHKKYLPSSMQKAQNGISSGSYHRVDDPISSRINSGHKKTPIAFAIGVLFICLTMSYSHMGTPTLPSALSRFTTEFEMDSGGTNSLLSSGKPLFRFVATTNTEAFYHSPAGNPPGKPLKKGTSDKSCSQSSD